MHLTPEARERIQALARLTLPKQFQGDLSFVCDLITKTLESKADLEQARSQLSTELRTYFETGTQGVVDSILAEVSRGEGKEEEAKTEVEAPSEKKRPSDQPRLDLSKTTIYLRKVPKDLNSIELLHTYFKQFGEIRNVQIFPNKNSAQICFALEEAASAALGSKDPVLDCKYIRVSAFRQKRQAGKVVNPDVEKRVKTKLAARELKQRRMQLSAEKTTMIQGLLKVLTERRNELSPDEQKALLSQIRLLGAEDADLPLERPSSD